MCNCRNCWWYGTNQCDQEVGNENCCYEPITEESSEVDEAEETEERRQAFYKEWNRMMGEDALCFSLSSTQLLKAMDKREYE